MARLRIELSPLRIPWWIQTVKRSTLWLLSRLQGVKVYRIVARKLVGKHVHYRVATIGDAHHLARLYCYDRFPELGNPIESAAGQIEDLQGSGHTLIAIARNQVVGGVVIRKFPENTSLYPDWWLFGMLVRKHYRGAGIGEGLARLALEKVAAGGITRINLMLFEQNTAALNLYRKMGFRSASIPGLDQQLDKEVQQGGRHRIIMSRPL